MKSNNPRVLELKSKRKMLYQSNEQLMEQIKKIDAELERELLSEELEQLNEFTDILNTMFQHPAFEKHCGSMTNRVYELMNDIDRVVINLEDDLRMELEQEDNEKETI